MTLLSDVLKAAFDFILPQSCILCNEEIQRGMICNNCLDYLPIVNPPLCAACGRPIKRNRCCSFCNNASPVDHGRAWLLFIPPSDKVIHHFKYRRKTRLANLLGRAMAGIINADHILSGTDIIVPIPLFWWKRIRRSYNQADILSRIVSAETGIRRQDLLKRIKNTRTQTRLSAEERRENVSNAFAMSNDDVQDKKVLLIDDVLTTGATVRECARILKEHGASAVYSCVAAITPDKPNTPSRHHPASSSRHRPA